MLGLQGRTTLIVAREVIQRRISNDLIGDSIPIDFSSVAGAFAPFGCGSWRGRSRFASGRPIDTISPQVLDTLLAYEWPGNVRELEHVIERGVILCHHGRLDLGTWLPQTRTAIRGPTLQTLETRERDYIVEVLQHTGWKVSGTQGAAQVLGLKPTTLEAHMQKLGIRRPR